MWPEVGRERQSEELDKGTQRRQLAKGDVSGSRHQTGEVTSRHEIGSRAVKEDRSRWVGIPSSFVEFSLEIHASVSLHMHIGNAMLHNSSSCAWLNPSILFVCSLSSHSLDCISCSYEEMCDAPIGTTSWSPAKKWNGSKKLTYLGGRGVIVTKRQSSQWKSPTLLRSKKARVSKSTKSRWSCSAICKTSSTVCRTYDQSAILQGDLAAYVFLSVWEETKAVAE